MEMERDLLYAILESIAKKDNEQREIVQIEGYNPFLVMYHTKLCHDAGWVRGNEYQHQVKIASLTFAGQIALAKFRKGFTVEAVLGV